MSFSIRNLRWILMRVYLPLPDFFIFGTKKWSLFDFHENFRKCLSPNYLATCKFSRPPMPGLYLNIVFENPAFRIACACALLHSPDFLRDDNKSRSTQDCWRTFIAISWFWVFVTLYQHSTASWFCDCLLLIVFDLFLCR